MGMESRGVLWGDLFFFHPSIPSSPRNAWHWTWRRHSEILQAWLLGSTWTDPRFLKLTLPKTGEWLSSQPKIATSFSRCVQYIARVAKSKIETFNLLFFKLMILSADVCRLQVATWSLTQHQTPRKFNSSPLKLAGSNRKGSSSDHHYSAGDLFKLQRCIIYRWICNISQLQNSWILEAGHLGEFLHEITHQLRSRDRAIRKYNISRQPKSARNYLDSTLKNYNINQQIQFKTSNPPRSSKQQFFESLTPGIVSPFRHARDIAKMLMSKQSQPQTEACASHVFITHELSFYWKRPYLSIWICLSVGNIFGNFQES